MRQKLKELQHQRDVSLVLQSSLMFGTCSLRSFYQHEAWQFTPRLFQPCLPLNFASHTSYDILYIKGLDKRDVENVLAKEGKKKRFFPHFTIRGAQRITNLPNSITDPRYYLKVIPQSFVSSLKLVFSNLFRE